LDLSIQTSAVSKQPNQFYRKGREGRKGTKEAQEIQFESLIPSLAFLASVAVKGVTPEVLRLTADGRLLIALCVTCVTDLLL